MKITYESYYHKVMGGWMGKSIAGNMGGPLECCRMILDFKTPEEFSPVEMMANDDLDVQLIWLNVILEKGLDFTEDDLMEAFIAHYQGYPNEYGYGKRNYMRGIRPPHSGVYANDFFRHSMGCPIRAEIWGMIWPGNPKEACRMAKMDGCLDHGEESIYAEQFTAAFESIACVEVEEADRAVSGQRFLGDFKGVLDKALSFIPADSKTAEVIRGCVEMKERNEPWRDCILQLWRKYGNQDSSTMFYNLGVEMLALLYGEGDFDRTVTLAVNGGYDTDCTAATVGAILGMMYGLQIINPKWISQVGEEIITGCNDLKYEMKSIGQLSETVCKIGVFISRKGKTPVIIRGGEPLELPEREIPVSITSEYEDGMDIAPGEIRTIRFHIRGMGTGGRVTANLALPEGLTGVCVPESLRIAKGEEAEVKAVIQMGDDRETIPEINRCRFVITEGERRWEKAFGLVGAMEWRIKGPYLDLYDFEDVSKEDREKNREYYKIPGAKIFRYMSLAEAHNNFADIDKEYLTEDFSKTAFEKRFQEGSVYYGRQDQLTVDEMFGFQGVCCVYAYTKIWCDADEELQMHVGSTTPYKLWLNGELKKEQKKSHGYSPYTDMISVSLRKGENQLAVKLLRYDGGQKFSMVFREYPFRLGGGIRTGFGSIRT